MYNCLKNFNFENKVILLRVGMDVPINKKGRITNDKRILEGLPTINYLLKNKVKQIIILNHLGRPKNKEEHLKHNKLAERLSYYLKKKSIN